MTEILLVGLSHKTAPVELREKLAFEDDELAQKLRSFAADAALEEALVVSTCNRVEFYGACEEPASAAKAVRALFRAKGAPHDPDAHLYEHRGRDAVQHAFRVTSSLDSMVVGEPQILGQVKRAYSTATNAGALGAVLGTCFTRAFHVAKRVRLETDIALGTVSVSSIACELAEKIFGSLQGRRVLLVGAGKMGENAARKLARLGAQLVVVNRSAGRAEEVARAAGGEPRTLDQLSPELVRADVVISSTGSQRFVITRELMVDAVRARKHRPLFVIDIAVPRDVDPRVGELDNVFLYDVDDLGKVAQQNLAARRRAAEEAERIVRSEVDAFETWRRSRSVTPVVVALRRRFDEVVRAELDRTAGKLGPLDAAQRKSLDAMANAIVNKLLHAPTAQLKRADEADALLLREATERLFELAPNPADASVPPPSPASDGLPAHAPAQPARRTPRGETP